MWQRGAQCHLWGMIGCGCMTRGALEEYLGVVGEEQPRDKFLNFMCPEALFDNYSAQYNKVNEVGKCKYSKGL